mgnify:FL=1
MSSKAMKDMLYYGQRKVPNNWMVENSPKPSYEDLQARIKELEAQLEAIGAGGVSGQRITQKGEEK